MVPYDRAIVMLKDALKAQEVWPSSRMLRVDILTALALLDGSTPRCETCQREMTRTASAPVGDSPMVWRCFHCIETGTVSAQGQEVIVVDEDGHVSVEPINEG